MIPPVDSAPAAATTTRWRLIAAALVLVFLAVHLAYIGAPSATLKICTPAAAEDPYRGDRLASIETYQKAVPSPPVTYWTIVPFYALLGVREASARMPTLLFGVLTMVAIYLFTRRRFDERIACLATMLLATSPLLWAFTGVICCNDVPFTLASALLMIAFVEADRLGTIASPALAGGAMGLTLLTKFVGGVYPIVVAVLLARRAFVSREPGRVRRLLTWGFAYAPGVGAAALFFAWLLYLRGSIVNTRIATSNVDMVGAFLLVSPARLAYYVCWIGLCAGPLVLVAAISLVPYLTRRRAGIALLVLGIGNVVALGVMQAAVAHDEGAVGEMRFGPAEHVLPPAALFALKIAALTAGEIVLLALWLWGRERSWPNGTTAYWTVLVVLLLSTWRGAQRYYIYLLPGLVIAFADLALRPTAPAWKRRVLTSGWALAVAAGLVQGVFITAYFATEGRAAADVARWINEQRLEGVRYELSGIVSCHCLYLIDPDRFAPEGIFPRYDLKAYGRSDPASDALYVREVRLLGVVWKKYGVAPIGAPPPGSPGTGGGP